VNLHDFTIFYNCMVRRRSNLSCNVPFAPCLLLSLPSITFPFQSSFAFGAAASLGVGLVAAAASGPVANFAKNIQTPLTTSSTTTVSSKPAVLTPQEQEATKAMAVKGDKGTPPPQPPPSLPPSSPLVPKSPVASAPVIDEATAERMKAAEREQFAKAASEARARAEKAAREAAEYRMKLYPDGPEARLQREKEAAEAAKTSAQKVRYLYACNDLCFKC
jgi:type IV secretory pathway VirB10-like protein